MARNKKHKIKFVREVQILREIHKEHSSQKSGSIGFPQLIHFETTKECFALAMEKLGPSLKDIKDQISKRISLKNTIMVGLQMVMLCLNSFS